MRYLVPGVNRYSAPNAVFRGQWTNQGGSDVKRGLLRGGVATLAAGTAALGIALAGVTGAPAGEPSELPNVIVIQTDDQTLESMRVMEETNAKLAERGATFPNHVTNFPLCCPSRATLQTGQYAHNHGIMGNEPPRGGYQQFDTSNTIAVWLEARGYVTAHVGKYMNGYGSADEYEEGERGTTVVPPGWTEWYTAAARGQNVYNYRLNENGVIVNYGATVEEFKQDVFTNHAVQLIDEHLGAGSPLYLQLDYTAPHGGGPNPSPQLPQDCEGTAKPAPRHANAFDTEPLPMPDSFNELDVSDKPEDIQEIDQIGAEELANITTRYRCRLESLLSVDEGVAAVMNALRAHDALDNTYILFTSDNGFFHGEHRIPTGKNRVYEEAIRVPLIMRGPDVPKGVVVEDMTTNADLAATIVDASGATPSLEIDGRSLLPAAKHPAIERGRELLIETPRYAAVRTQRYEWVEHRTGEAELYDLVEDPSQLTSLHADPELEEVRERLATRLAALRTCAGDSCLLKPALEPKLKLDRGRHNGKNCVDARIKAGFEGDDKAEIAAAEFFAEDDEVSNVDSAPFKYEYRPRDLDKGKATIRLRASLIDGRRSGWEKDLRICP